MKTQHLRCFLQVADKGSMRAAADYLGVSATAVSQALRELERSVGVPLLTRQAQGVALTYAGRRLLQHARLILAQVERAEEEIAQIQGLKGGAIAIGVTPWVSQAILPRAIAEFQCMRPGVRLDIYESVGTAHTGLREGTLDFAIGLAPPANLLGAFLVRDLFVYGLAVIGRVGHPLAGATALRELGEQNWVMTLREDGREQRHSAMLASAGLALQPSQVHYARSGYIVQAMIDGSDMITVCPWPLVESPLMRHRVAAFSLQDKLPDMVTSLVMRRADTLSSAAQQFFDCFMIAAYACRDSLEPGIKRMMSSVEFLGD